MGPNGPDSRQLWARPPLWWLWSRLIVAFAIGLAVGAYGIFSLLAAYDPSLRPFAWGFIALINLLLIAAGIRHLHLFLERWTRYFWLPKAPPRIRGDSALLPPVPRDYEEAAKELIFRVCALFPDLESVADRAIRVRGSLFVPPSLLERDEMLMRLMAWLIRDQVDGISIHVHPIRTEEEAEGALSLLPQGVAVRLILPLGFLTTWRSTIGRIVPGMREGMESLEARGLFWLGRERRIVHIPEPQTQGSANGEGEAVSSEDVIRFLIRPEGLAFLPLVPVSRIDFDPIPLEEALRKASKPSFYVGTSLHGIILSPIGHLMVVGRTGSGKTTFARNLIRCAMAFGFRVLVYTPKGNGDSSDLVPPELAGGDRIRFGLDLIKSVDPTSDSDVIVVVDEATELLSRDAALKEAIAKILRMGRARNVWSVLVAQSLRSEILPIDLRQHQSLVVLPTEPGEIGYLERYYDVSLGPLLKGLTPGRGVWVPTGNRVPKVFRFPWDGVAS